MRLNLITPYLITLSLIAFALAAPTISHAQTQSASPSASQSATPSASALYSTPTPSVTITSVPTKTIQGQIITVNSNNLDVKTDNDTKNLPVPSDSKITLDNNPATLSQLKPGDQVTATINSATNEVLTLSATSQKAASLTKWIIGGIIIALIILGLIYWLIKKSRTQHIKTSPTRLR